MVKAQAFTAVQLRELLDYDPTTGVFTHRRWRPGRAAGVISHGYRRIEIGHVPYYAHRLAWLYVYGEWPLGCLDHINGDRTDNRIANLREATHRQNSQNWHHPTKCSRSGIMGVVLQPSGRWAAYITVNKRTNYLGTFDSAEEASVAYRSAKQELHPFWVPQ